MKSIQELGAANNITDTSTSQISEVQGQQWMTKIVQFGEALRRFDQACLVSDWLVGKGDTTLTIPKTTSVKDVTVSSTEGDVRTVTELDNLDTVALTVGASDFKRGVVSITKQILLTSRIDLIAQARYVVAEAIAQDVDLDIRNELQDTAVTQIVYGGNATGVDSLADLDVMTPELVANAMTEIENNNFVPAYLYIHTKSMKAFRKESQFVNASEYGSDRVVLRGEIGEYLGVKVITTTNCETFANGATDRNESSTAWSADGHTNIMIGTQKNGSPCAIALAWKEKPHVDYEYEKDESLHKIYYDQAYKVGIVQPKAVCLIKVTDV